jgi:hypothetical protein
VIVGLSWKHRMSAGALELAPSVGAELVPWSVVLTLVAGERSQAASAITTTAIITVRTSRGRDGTDEIPSDGSGGMTPHGRRGDKRRQGEARASRSSRAASSGETVLMLMAELSSNPAGVESFGRILMCQQKIALCRPSDSLEYTTKL